MYRKHLRMVLLRDLESNKVRSKFLNKIASIPVVYLAWNIATDTYFSIKTSNKYINLSLTSTERAAIFISKPVVKKLSKQLAYADHLACRGLEAVLAIIPSIKNRKEKIYRRTKVICDGTIESGLKKYAVIKKLGAKKLTNFIDEGNQKFEELSVSPYGEACGFTLDIIFGACEIYVDYYLPPLGDERPEIVFGDRGKEPKLKRAQLLKNRIKERLYKHSLLKVQTIRLRTKFVIAQISKFNLHQYLVQVSSSIPSVINANVMYVFSSIEDLISYLVSLFAGKAPKNQENIV